MAKGTSHRTGSSRRVRKTELTSGSWFGVANDFAGPSRRRERILTQKQLAEEQSAVSERAQLVLAGMYALLWPCASSACLAGCDPRTADVIRESNTNTSTTYEEPISQGDIDMAHETEWLDEEITVGEGFVHAMKDLANSQYVFEFSSNDSSIRLVGGCQNERRLQECGDSAVNGKKHPGHR